MEGKSHRGHKPLKLNINIEYRESPRSNNTRYHLTKEISYHPWNTLVDKT